ncbi:arylesterase [Erythrobacter insulae]|uniref:Arylesterase n=1 Tax=Erythrobacter insulae TaxID=2584124 RepID=A0A547PDF6_9SPHN|nr:arylesterase [Erythrobacter insulae]TRD12173.1 arylesterase [Erythrobacter insulae]
MKRTLRCGVAVAMLPLALAACSENAADGAAVPDTRASSEEINLPAIPVMGPEVTILAFGNSLFAGYGLSEGESYPAKLERALRSKGINAVISNAGVSGDTSAAGLQRLTFTLDAQKQKPDLFILELGGNDLLRGLSPAETRANLSAMMDELKDRDIPVLLMGMRAPPNYGPEYQADFDALYGDLAQEYDADLIPFWLEDIYQEPTLFQSDRIHPTAEGIETLVSSTLEKVEAALPEPVGDLEGAS